MKYEKPEITLVTSALAAVQGGSKDSPDMLEVHSIEPQRTQPAYEADE